jgi:hypothetical protein
VTPAQHLLTWATPERRQLLNGLAFDRLANRPRCTFARFLKKEKWVTMEKAGLIEYYPLLRLVGYLPPKDVWEPTEPLTAEETSSDLRTWFTPARRELISRHAADRLSGRPPGVLNRYLHNETHITFKIIGLSSYHQTLSLLGFKPPNAPEQ